MLIMSQDRKSLYTLEGLSEICLSSTYGDYQDGESVKIIATLPRDVEAVMPLGTYKNETRAMEVLDEIANEYGKYLKYDGRVNPIAYTATPPFAFSPPKVYRMPER